MDGPQARGWPKATYGGQPGGKEQSKASSAANNSYKAKAKHKTYRHQNSFPPPFGACHLDVRAYLTWKLLTSGGKTKLATISHAFLPEGFWFHFCKGGDADQGLGRVCYIPSSGLLSTYLAWGLRLVQIRHLASLHRCLELQSMSWGAHSKIHTLQTTSSKRTALLTKIVALRNST